MTINKDMWHTAPHSPNPYWCEGCEHYIKEGSVIHWLGPEIHVPYSDHTFTCEDCKSKLLLYTYKRMT